MTSQSTISQRCKNNAWHSQPTVEVRAQFAVAAEGFCVQETQQQLVANGLDERVNGNHVSPSHNFFGRFQSHIIWILIVAGVLLALLGESVDVMAVVVLNAIIVFYQEFSVEKPIQRSR